MNTIFSVISCPHCGFKKEEKIPVNTCLLKYRCDNCKAVLRPLEKDCCVFCSWGDAPCPGKVNIEDNILQLNIDG